jgi:hypothetical protein
MNEYLYYNTLHGCETDGENVYLNGKQLKPFVPKDRARIYFRINKKSVSQSKINNPRYLVLVKENKIYNLPDWAK